MGYNRFCSSACSNKSDTTRQKMKDTWMKTLGVDNPLKSTKVREKSYDTMEQKYGSKFAMQNSELHQKYVNTMVKTYGDSIPIRNECIKKSIEHTTEERYGAKHIFSSEYGKQKCIQTSKEKYGTEYPMQSEIVKANHIKSVHNKYNVDNVFELEFVKEHIKSTNLKNKGVEYSTQWEATKDKIQKTKQYNQEQFSKEYNCIPIAALNIPNVYYYINLLNIKVYKHKNINYIFTNNVNDILEACNKDSKKCGSLNEYEINNFIKSIYNGKILNNNRQIIKPKELDIYIPEKQVAIEHNGIWWHSTNCGTNKLYHKSKTDDCLSKNIRLIHIFEDDWKLKNNIYKSFISQALGIYDTYINDTECYVKNISLEEVNSFMVNNSLGYYEIFNNNFGLFYKNELIQVLSYSKNKIGSLCTKLNTFVTSGYKTILLALETQVYELNIDISFDSINNYSNLNIVKKCMKSPQSFFVYKNERFYSYNKLLSNLNENDNGYLEIYNAGYITLYIGEHNESCL